MSALESLLMVCLNLGVGLCQPNTINHPYLWDYPPAGYIDARDVPKPRLRPTTATVAEAKKDD